LSVKEEVSIIIPSFNDKHLLEKLLLSLSKQTYQATEIIIVDSSSNDQIKDYIKKNSSDSKLTYHYSESRLFPYEASNLGATIARSEWLLFIDTKTLPKSNWIESYLNFAKEEKAKVVFGVTKYLASSFFQGLLRDSTYGRVGLETAPGSLIRKKDFIESGPIISGVRSGGDVEWKNRLKSSDYECFTPNNHFLEYSDLPINFFKAVRKFFIYQLYSALVNIQHNIKDLFLGLSLILSAIIIPQWNAIVGWEESLLYIPYVTRIYLICFVVLFFLTFFINKIFLKGLTDSFTANAFKTIIFISLFMIIYKWNAVVASWVEESVWYVPNITKIYVGGLILTSIIYRGWYFPLKHKVPLNELIPFRWILIGLLGLALDLAKAPGYLLGSVIMPFIKRKK